MPFSSMSIEIHPGVTKGYHGLEYDELSVWILFKEKVEYRSYAVDSSDDQISFKEG